MPEMKVVEQPEVAEGAEAAPAPAGPAKVKTLGIIAGAVVLGISLGAFALGPRLAGSPGEKAEEPAAKKSHGGGGAHGGSSGSFIEIDNVVVNPAGSQGAHFLMATVALDVHEKEAEEYLRMNEHIVKDVIMKTLGSQTLEMLSEPGARDALKGMLAQDIGALVDDPEVVTVYLPEFVVQ
jgi:flagellar basal body-associated protein FliL